MGRIDSDKICIFLDGPFYLRGIKRVNIYVGIRVFWKGRNQLSYKQYRNEWKYSCSERDLNILDFQLRALLERDEHNETNEGYEIHSLYFDDIKDACARENDAGVSRRFKYRIRYYGNRHSELKLERKEKLEGRCYKDSCNISSEQYLKIVSGKAEDVLWETDKHLLKRFCVHWMCRGFRPKAIINYRRVAYVEPITNVRVTLDKNITVSDEVSGFLLGTYLKIPVQENQEHILEVKFDSILPSYVKALMSNRRFVQIAFSKYYYGRKKLQVIGRR